MKHLKALDEVAYVRFASVYREFKDVNEFVSELKSLKNVEANSALEKEEVACLKNI